MIFNVMRILNNYPHLKTLLKKGYYYLGAVLSFWLPKIAILPEILIKRIPVQNPAFFGYYDLPPLLHGQILYHEIQAKQAELHLYNLTSDTHQKIAESKAWNYQQGSRLGWLGCKREIVFYNELSHGILKTVLHDLLDQSITTLAYPAASFSGEGEYYASIDFKKISELNPEYGYKGYIDSLYLRDSTPNQGITILETKSQQIIQTYSMQQILAISPSHEQNAENSEINHVSFSPDSASFAFVHRWYPGKGKRKSRLVIGNVFTSQLEVVLDEGMVSHYTWLDNKGLFVYGRSQNKNQFITIDLNGAMSIKTHPGLAGFGDGHPSYDSVHNRVVIDSYPDFLRYQKLYTYDIANSRVRQIGKFKSPVKYFGDYRCDLHPRWVEGGKAVVIDTTYTGKRDVVHLTISEDY